MEYPHHQGNVTKHFSGNFWWANSSHISTLETIGGDYLDPEMWVLGSKPNVRYVAIDKILDLYDFEYNMYYKDTSMEDYLQNIIFQNTRAPFSKETLQVSQISSMEIGLRNAWAPCVIPTIGNNVSLTLATLGNPQDLHFNTVKIIRVHMKSGETLYFLENEIIDIV